MQQELLLKKYGRKQSPQDEVLSDLGKFITKKRDEGNEILICIDANESMEDKNSKIKEFANKHGLFDIAGDRHTVQIPATFERVNTSRRINFFLCTGEVFINVLAYGMAPGRYDKILGDHRAQYVDINTNELLQLNSHDISSPSGRKLRSTDPKCTKTYIEKLLINLDKHNITQRMESLLK